MVFGGEIQPIRLHIGGKMIEIPTIARQVSPSEGGQYRGALLSMSAGN